MQLCPCRPAPQAPPCPQQHVRRPAHQPAPRGALPITSQVADIADLLAAHHMPSYRLPIGLRPAIPASAACPAPLADLYACIQHLGWAQGHTRASCAGMLQVMAYSDFAFDDLDGKSEDARRFPSHKEVGVCAALCACVHPAAWQPQLLPVHTAELRAGPAKPFPRCAAVLQTC